MRQIRRTALLCLLLMLWASAAAADNPFYLTGRLGSTSVDADLGNAFRQVLDGDDNSLALGLGFRLGKYMAFQAEWHDLGEVPGAGSPCPDDLVNCIELLVPIEADSSAVSVSFLPHLPFAGERFFLYGKLGFVSWESDVSEALDAGSRFIDDFGDEDLVWGLGFRVMLPGPFAAFAEYESIADSFETVSLGATFGF